MATPPVPPTFPDATALTAEQAPADVPASANHNNPGEARNSQSSRGQSTITPEPRPDQPAMNSQTSDTTPSTPGVLAPFDWEDFQARYEAALADADEDERAVLAEFERLSNYFNVWASAAATHDNERAVKRLQTRQRYVSLSEESMAQKQKHYDEVLRAFQSALALLSSK